jgi:acetolactate decarboxylase
MNRRLSSLVFGPLIALTVALSARAGGDRETLYQVSTINALLVGVYEPLTTIGEVLSQGDSGLGTFEALDGELILLEGRVYRAGADGRVEPMPPETGTPFMAVTHFDADQVLEPPRGQDYAAFKLWLESRLPSRNIAYALRLDGVFDRILFRSVPGQSKPYPPLAEVAAQQRVFEAREIGGTLIGFWCPDFTQGVNVPGFHLHFLSADRQRGGHLLDFSLARGQVQLDLTHGWRVQLPLDPAFLDSDLGGDHGAVLHAVEQGQLGR